MGQFTPVVTRRTYTIEALYESEIAEENFGDFVARVVSSVPAEFRPQLKIAMPSDYDCTTYLKIFYERPETDEEMESRAAKQAEATKRQKEYEDRKDRVDYERLKAKFEGR